MLKNSFKEVDRIAYDNTVIAVYESLQGEHNEDVFDCFANNLKLNYLERLVLKWWMADVKLRLAKLYNQTQFSDNQQVPIPVFYGGTGNGKSRLTRAITKVLGALAVQKNIGEVTDKFGHQQWGRLLVADFDEMAGMQRADMEQFKQWCTQDKIQRRGIFGDGQITTYKITTGIGSSNQPVDEILYDTTTSRRLFQIDAQVDGSWHDVIERTDFLGLWQSIDCDYKPSTEELKQIAKEQHNNQRRKSQIENWFEECLENIKVIQSNCNDWIGAAKLYDIYKNWCLDSNEKPVTNTKFGKEIKKFNWFEFKISGGKKYQL